MPIYEYECKNCGQRFDKMQPITADPLTECELCGKGPVRRVPHPAGVIFKGSGWYVTDNRKSNSSSSGGSNSSGSSAGTGGSGGASSNGTDGAKNSTESKGTTESSKSASSDE